MNTINSQNIYEILKKLKENKDFFDIPEIQDAITRFEDAISCVITNPEKLNTSLEYNLQLIISSLVDLLKNKNKDLRKSQIASLISIMDHIISGNTKGLIKLPTGAGKTRLFTEIVTGINLPTLILVPKINLKGQTSEYFEGDNVFNIGENGTVLQNTRQILKSISENNIPNPIIIVTYKSFIILKKDKELFEEFSKLIKVVIRDEAHRSLGDKTEEALDEMHSYSDVPSDILQKQDEDLLETDVLYSSEKLELLFTATPNLLDKSVRDNYELIYGLKLQDLVEEGVLHMPKFIQVSETSVHIGDLNVGERVLNGFATKFMNENGEYTYMEIVNKYLELKKANNEYMPAVGFCRDIEHAEFIKKYLQERGVRAIRVTSSNSKLDKGVNEDEAKKMIEANEVDVVVTVTKVSEGWDVQTLRCALNFAPILSEAKYIQGIGRVLRTFDYKKNEELNIQNGILEKEFAFVIEPKFWNIVSGNGKGGGGGNGGDEPTTKDNPNNKTTKISGITHLIESGEFDINYLRDLYGNLDEYSEIVTKEEVLDFFKTQKSFDEWMSLNSKQIRKIKYKDKGIVALTTLAGWNNINNVNLEISSGFQEFIAWVFNKEVEKINKDEVLDFFKNEKSFDEWMSLNQKQISRLKYKDKGINALATLTGWNNPNNVNLQTPSGFQEYIAWVFHKESEIITKNKVLDFFKTEKSFDEWMSLRKKQIIELKYKDKRINALATLAGWDNPNNVSLVSVSGFQEFIAWVFNKEVEITKEKVLEFFKNSKTFDEWISSNLKQIKELKYKDKGINALATLAGWDNPNNVSLVSVSGFQEFIAWVFNKEVEKINKDEILDFFKTEKSFEQWVSLQQRQIIELRYKDKGINALVTLAGWENPNNVSLKTISGFQEYIAWVFHKESEIITKDKVLDFFKTEKSFDEWMSLNQNQIRKLKYKNKGINALVTLAGWENPNNSIYNTSGFREFIAWVFDKENPNKKS